MCLASDATGHRRPGFGRLYKLNFLTAGEVVSTRAYRFHAAPGRSSRCKQSDTPTTSIIWSVSSASAFLSLVSAAASAAVSILSTEVVCQEFAAAALQGRQMGVGSFGIGGHEGTVAGFLLVVAVSRIISIFKISPLPNLSTTQR